MPMTNELGGQSIGILSSTGTEFLMDLQRIITNNYIGQ